MVVARAQQSSNIPLTSNFAPPRRHRLLPGLLFSHGQCAYRKRDCLLSNLRQHRLRRTLDTRSTTDTAPQDFTEQPEQPEPAALEPEQLGPQRCHLNAICSQSICGGDINQPSLGGLTNPFTPTAVSESVSEIHGTPCPTGLRALANHTVSDLSSEHTEPYQGLVGRSGQ